MKKCPKCHKTYVDETLNFCLDDGEWLVSESGGTPARHPAETESDTAILSEAAKAAARYEEPATRPQIHTTAGARRYENSGSLPKSQDLPTGRRAWPLAAAGLAAVLLVGGYFGYRAFSPPTSEQISSIAVMPLQNRSGDADTDYLSDGLADSLIYRLSQLPGLRVSPTNAVMRYKGKETDTAQIAKELGVDAVMSGRLVQRGDDLSISVQLVDSRSNNLIWAEQYERKMADLLATQREIASTIAQKLQLKLSGGEATGVTKKYTNNNAAYNLYLKGRFYWNKRTAEGVKKAVEQFQQAADADPAFALAYVGLADCYVVMEQYASTPSSETIPKARAAALRALEIDDSLSEAHTSLGNVYSELWQPAESEREYKRAIELNPNYPTAHHWYSILLTTLGRSDQAMAEVQRAQAADPLSPIIAINVGLQHYLRGEYDAAAAQYQKALELNPNFPRAFTDLGLIYAKQGRKDEAISSLQRAADASGRANEVLGFLGYGYGSLGRRVEAEDVLKELEARHARRESPAMYAAAVYASLGDKDRAFEWLEKDFRERTGLLPFISVLPIFEPLRDDPRYADLMRRMGLR
jgi:TolB-like protein/Tfp pilus assembly protein PilF